ncbi:DoxX family protein [Pseudofulvibacter geojedonensis]|uniref:DoxX family protein n=1 Tax=Pseudofulvibacter geojedonensis TaxID=1123758 RepID=A0ABW3I217_9FLAO
MDTIKKINKWANLHSYYPIDILRISLGVFLFTKGLYFMNNSLQLVELIQPFKNYVGEMILIHYLVPAHIIGGILIVFGLLTRWALIAQIPILIGAVLINVIGEFQVSNFIIAGITLLIAIFFTYFGSGKHSADYHLKMQQ